MLVDRPYDMMCSAVNDADSAVTIAHNEPEMVVHVDIIDISAIVDCALQACGLDQRPARQIKLLQESIVRSTEQHWIYKAESNSWVIRLD